MDGIPIHRSLIGVHHQVPSRIDAARGPRQRLGMVWGALIVEPKRALRGQCRVLGTRNGHPTPAERIEGRIQAGRLDEFRLGLVPEQHRTDGIGPVRAGKTGEIETGNLIEVPHLRSGQGRGIQGISSRGGAIRVRGDVPLHDGMDQPARTLQAGIR